MSLRFAAGMALWVGLLMGCGSQPPISSPEEGLGSSANGGDPTQDPSCSASPASYQPYATEAELEALLIRRWKRCIAPQVPGEDVGVEFTADGRWYALTRDAGGHVVRRTGIDYGGTWRYDPTPTPGLANGRFYIGDVQTNPPWFTNDPRQMRILFSPVMSKYLPLDP
jgi:hypothetical protein